MKLKELLHGLDVLELHADEALDITGVQYDSRQVTPGALFVAISGFQTDGHKYIPKAMENGAVCVVCEKKPETDIPYVLVSNARSALAALGANWFGHPADAMCVVGITGTNGKTTSTYLLKHVLEKTLGAKVGLIGTIQNMIGDEILHTERTTPESFELQKLFADMRDAGCTHVIMEVSSHALVLHRADQIRFGCGCLYKSDRGPSRFPSNDGCILRREGHALPPLRNGRGQCRRCLREAHHGTGGLPPSDVFRAGNPRCTHGGAYRPVL